MKQLFQDFAKLIADEISLRHEFWSNHKIGVFVFMIIIIVLLILLSILKMLNK